MIKSSVPEATSTVSMILELMNGERRKWKGSRQSDLGVGNGTRPCLLTRVILYLPWQGLLIYLEWVSKARSVVR